MTPPDLRTDIPHSARIYDYLLGGKDNFEVDRAVGEKIRQATPGVPISMAANRRFMARVSRWLAERGFRQFLDVGTGLPTHPNLHEVVQEVHPAARIVYVDNDPLILVHARALLIGSREGSVTYLDADLREPADIVGSDEVLRTFDLSQPVSVSVIAVLQHIVDDRQAGDILAELMRPLAPGSSLALSVVTVDNDPTGGDRTIAAYNRGGVPAVARTHDQAVALFGDLDIQEPGVVPVHHWHPDERETGVRDEDVYMYGGVAFKR